MKKIIKGKVYDTDTARQLGLDGGGDGFSSWHEELYQKRTGEFFLYGKGGPATKYAHHVDGSNMWSGGDKIIPLTADAAREWVEEHLTADEYEEIFGLPDEDAEPVALNIVLPASLMAQVRNIAADSGKTLTAVVTEMLSSQIGGK